MALLQLLDIAIVAVAYWMPLRFYKRRDLSLDLIAGVQVVAIICSMVVCTTGLWDRWIGLMLLAVVTVSALLTALLYREEAVGTKSGY